MSEPSPARVLAIVLPTTAAGMSHVVVLKWNLLRSLAVPLDGGRQWHGEPLLGANKTWRGVIVMVTFGALFTGAQGMIEQRLRRGPSLTADFRVNPWLAGGLMGLGYCLGEIPNSFVKRRLQIAPGMRRGTTGLQYLLDQMDSVAGCLLMLRLFYRPRPGEIRASLLLGTTIHIGVDCLLYVLGVKRFR